MWFSAAPMNVGVVWILARGGLSFRMSCVNFATLFVHFDLTYLRSPQGVILFSREYRRNFG